MTDNATAAVAIDGQATTGPPLLEVAHLATGYGDLRVVWDLSLTVEAGHVTALLGRNGAGKTTALRAVAGLNPVSEGSVRLKGKDIAALPVHRRIRHGVALVQDNKRIFRRRTVEENLVLGGYAMRRRDLRAALDRAYTQFPVLASRRQVHAASLSGGQQQMLAIAQALMPGPELLMLDEPSSGLAPAICDDVFAIISDLRASGIGILLVEQEVGRALRVADEVIVIDVGRVSLSRPAAEIADFQTIRHAYFGSHGSAGTTG